jgi:hypothetical protein
LVFCVFNNLLGSFRKFTISRLFIPGGGQAVMAISFCNFAAGRRIDSWSEMNGGIVVRVMGRVKGVGWLWKLSG